MLASLRFRLWLTYLLVVGAALTIAGLALVVYLLRNPAVERRELQRLRLVAQVALQRRSFFDDRGPGLAPLNRLDEATERLDGVLGARLIVFDAGGALLADSRQGSAAPPPALDELNRPRLQRVAVFRDGDGQQWLYVVTPLDAGQTLITAAPRPRVQLVAILRDEFMRPFANALIVSLALSFLMTALIARWITAPLQRLSAAVRSVANGEFRRIPPGGPREMQELARAFNEMTERVEASQRAQRDLVANVSHDLKTPLTSIQGFAQALLDGTASDPADARRAAQVIFDESARMSRMLFGLLDLARFDAGQTGVGRAPFDLAALLAGLVQKFSPAARQAQVDLMLEIAPLPGAPHAVPERPVMMLGDPDRLGQAFANLLDNALKYTPAGGQVRVWLQPGDGWVDVRVLDDGPGIPPAELERVFERFYQTDKSRRSGRHGAGLGLAIAREIVQAHGGTIRAENRPAWEAGGAPGGAVFTAHLPTARPDEETPAQRRGEPPATLTPSA